MVPEKGKWAVSRGSYGQGFNPDVWEIAAVTEKLVKYIRWGTQFGQVPKEDVMAVFSTKEEADLLCQSIAGIKGERDRRIRAANDAAEAALKKLLARQLGENRRDA